MLNQTKSPTTTEILNRLLVLHSRSLPMYLSYAPPEKMWTHPQAARVFNQMVEDHKRTVDRLANLILESGGLVAPGEFPMAFTGLHDLSLDYLLKMLVERQRKFIAASENLANMLHMAPFAQAVAREAVGEAKGHLENLEELAGAAV